MIRTAGTLLLGFFLFMPGCSRQGDISLEDAIIEYRNDGGSKHENIGRGMLSEISLVRLGADGLATSGTCLYYRNGDSMDIVYPDEKKIDAVQLQDAVIACSDEKRTALGAGSAVRVYGPGSPDSVELSAADTGDRIKALLINNGTVYYYKGHRLFSQGLDQDQPRLLVSDRFSPPYKKYYQVWLHGIKGVLGIVAGSAGSYYISAVGLSPAKTMVTNISASSSKIALTDRGVYYIFGGSGNWDLLFFRFAGKTKQTIRKFKDLRSIELTGSSYIFQDSGGLWIQDYDKNIIKIPFDLGIEGKYGDFVLLSCSGYVYVTDLRMLMEKLEQLKIKIPELFT
ncbi:MAG TPA: hypothetical protein PK926_11560 [Spirochaetota bacterium]|nr:hypothetical protein [Spirochaetota bacterium]HPI89137.1 hypothetical protein [Spirochaetota bacterium]HPR48891.1 hypothetical protein [Spirochaetota bacterium]